MALFLHLTDIPCGGKFMGTQGSTTNSPASTSAAVSSSLAASSSQQSRISFAVDMTAAARLLLSLWLLLEFFFSDSLEAANPPRRPNVVMVIFDDLRPVLGAYGDPLASTPIWMSLPRGAMSLRGPTVR